MRALGRLAATTLLVIPAQAQNAAKPGVIFGGFVDTYYAYDFGRPPGLDRLFTTQPARHNEFNVNLAFVEVGVRQDRIRGRVALQAGTSVQSNYAGEPTIGSVSGGTLSRHIQEAWAGVRLGEHVWVDGGIFYSHIGQESWASRDNATYTRSFVADFTPYYSTGVRLTWRATPKLTAHVHLVNGWQVISETNGAKSGGIRLELTATTNLLIGYSNFLGNEMPDSMKRRIRFLNQGFAKATLGKTEWWLTVDYGRQDTEDVDGASWHGVTFVGKVRAADRVSVSWRVERYSDPDQIIVSTGLPYGFGTWSGSLGLDVGLADAALWRLELRGMRGDDPLWAGGTGPLKKGGGFVVTSLGLTF